MYILFSVGHAHPFCFLYVQLRERSTDLCFDTFAGIDNNETPKVLRSGGADPDGNHPGDLYVTIKVLQ